MPSPSSRAVVTGASGRLGGELAKQLAARGHHVIVAGRRADVLNALAAEITARYGVLVEVRAVDLAEPRERGRFAEELSRRDISILVANAGVVTPGPLSQLSPAAVQAQVQINVLGVHELALAVLPGMLTRSAGGILISGSAAGNAPIPNFTTYAASKAFVNTFCESLRAEVKGSGVHVTLLAPGLLRDGDTPSCVPDVLWSSYEHTATMALNALERNTMRVVPGLTSKIISSISGYAPRSLIDTPAALAIYRPRKVWVAVVALSLIVGLVLTLILRPASGRSLNAAREPLSRRRIRATACPG